MDKHGSASSSRFEPSADDREEIRYLASGGQEAVAELFTKYRPQLERMVTFRLDRRLYGRVDPADVLQEAYLEIARRMETYLEAPPAAFFLWARQITWQTLLMAHRAHLGAQKRDAGREVALGHAGVVDATSMSLAAQLVAHLTSPSQAAIRDERYAQLRAALDTMDEVDREVLALRHFEHLGNNEVAAVLNISVKAASNRYVRALKRLKEILSALPEV
jgi:RNA polymerase sigma-70 factor (ECF subfamily)